MAVSFEGDGKLNTSFDGFATGANIEINNMKGENEAKHVLAGVGHPDDPKAKPESKSDSKSKNTVDANRCNNARNRAAEDRVTGTITLFGVPILKAALCINVLNVGPRASGKWYVKSVDHEWDVVKGYRTAASLVRGQLPECGKNKSSKNVPDKTGSPVTLRADIYKKGDVILAPRDLNAAIQETFVYGADDLRIDTFTCSFHKLEKKGKDNNVSGTTHLVDKKQSVADPKAPKSTKGDPGSGGVPDL